MNLPAKTAVFAEVHRVLRPGRQGSPASRCARARVTCPTRSRGPRTSAPPSSRPSRTTVPTSKGPVSRSRTRKTAPPPLSVHRRRGRSATLSSSAPVHATHRQQRRRDEGGPPRRVAAPGLRLSFGRSGTGRPVVPIHEMVGCAHDRSHATVRPPRRRHGDLCRGVPLRARTAGLLTAGEFVPEVALEYPDALRALHVDYQRAGSDVVEAFTYNGHREKMRVIGKEDLLEPLNRAACRSRARWPTRTRGT